MSRFLIPACLCAAVSMFADLAVAQVAPDLQDAVTQGAIVNRSVGEAARSADVRAPSATDEIDGEGGVYVLTVNRIFHATASGELGYTSNPTQTAGGDEGAGYADLGAGIGLATVVDGRFDVGLSGNFAARQFLDDDNDSPSSRSISTTASVGTPLFGRVYGALVAFGGFSFDEDFDNRAGFYGLSSTLSTIVPVTSKLALRPGVGLTQQWSSISANRSLTATVSADATYQATPKLLLSGRVSVSRRDYADFYEDVTFVARKDTLYGLGLGATYRLPANVLLAGSLSYEKQTSSLFLSAYEAYGASAAASLRRVF